MTSDAVRLHFAAVLVCFACCLAGTAGRGAETAGLPAGFVHLREIDPTILQDIRYASSANFTRTRVPGYLTGECILLREAAEALKLVQTDLQSRGLSLKVYDCYRPVRAVKAFMLWVRKPTAAGDMRYWPRIERSELIKLGYIAENSIHSTGAAVDLTLVAFPFAQAAPFDPEIVHGACNAPWTNREPDSSLDMGTSFDCFDTMSNTVNSEITAEQNENRRMLAGAMSARGFKNYFREWWHFTYTALASLPQAQDFAITRNNLASAAGRSRGRESVGGIPMAPPAGRIDVSK